MFNIEIKNNNEYGPVVSSRTVASELGKEHKTVLRELDNTLKSDGTDLYRQIIKSEYKNERGKKYREYLLTEKGFTVYMFNIQGYNEFKIAYVNEFERMKNQLQQNTDSYMIDDPVERAKRWIEEAEQRKALETKTQEQAKQIEQDKPKVLFADTLASSNNSILIGELAKLITQGGYPIGQNKLFKWLRDNGFLCKSGERYNLPTQYSIDMNLLDIKKRVINNSDGSSRVTRTTKVTGKGQNYFVNKFIKGNEKY